MTDKTMTIYWFFALFLIASAVVFIIYNLYGMPLDVREVEGIFLGEKIADCVSRGGQIPLEILDSKEGFLLTNENFLEKCQLTFKTENIFDWNNDQYFASVFFSSISGGNSLYSVEYGNKDLMTNANFNFLDPFRKNKFPFCINRTIFPVSSGRNNDYYAINITSCVRKTEKNA